MKEIFLTNGLATSVDDDMYDYLNQWKWHLSTNGYAKRNLYVYNPGQKTINIFMHHIVLPRPDKMFIDHIDRNKLNNVRTNLRVCTNPQNQANKGKRKDNTSGRKGVSWGKYARKWRATMTVSGKHVSLGCYNSVDEAYKAYLSKSRELYGEFTYEEDIINAE